MESSSGSSSSSQVKAIPKGSFGAKLKKGTLNLETPDQWEHLRKTVMKAVKDVMIEYLAPKHRNQWEYAVQKCFHQATGPTRDSLVLKQQKLRMAHDLKQQKQKEKYRVKADKKKQDENLACKHAQLMRQVARLFLWMKSEAAPRVQLLQICSVVSSTSSLLKFNSVLDEVHEEMVAEGLLQGGAVHDEDEDEGDTQEPVASSCSALPPPTSLSLSSSDPPDSLSLSSTEHDTSSLSLLVDAQAPPPQAPPPQKRRFLCSKKLYAAGNRPTAAAVAASASESRLRIQNYAKRCLAYDENSTVSTAVRMVEQEEGVPLIASDRDFRKMSSSSIIKRNKSGDVCCGGGGNNGTTPANAVDDRVVRNRLGYKSAAAFCDGLDIMQKIRAVYSEAMAEKDTDTKDLLLGLICGSFSLSEANRFLLPPEAHILPPGRVKNMELISMQKWTFIRKAVGCNTLHKVMEPEKYAEGIRKRKRNKELQLLAQADEADEAEEDEEGRAQKMMALERRHDQHVALMHGA